MRDVKPLVRCVLAWAALTTGAQAQEYPIAPVPLTAVHLTDRFWAPRLETNRTVTIPHIMRQNELTGRVDNFLKAARRKTGPYQGQRYNDTDVYKVIEAASFSLAAKPDPALDAKLDELIAIVAAAQEPDGYIYTPRTVDPANPAPGAGPDRWSWLHTSHELYDQGHLIEAAVAHFDATHKRTLLDVAIKSANLIGRVFGPSGRRDVPGHEEIELALVKLYRATGERKYLDTAAFFIDERGRTHSVEHPQFEPGSRFSMYNDLAYRQDHARVETQRTAVGHAVRATYLYSAMMDIATLLDNGLAATVRALFGDVTGKKMYVTGGLGSEGRTEAFAGDYVLPNRAYAETCASVGGILWYHRLFLRDGNSASYDVLERTLYNGYLSGVSLAGNAFFYQNPLVSDGRVERSAYFDVACCPANLSRLMAQLPGLMYAQRETTLYVGLFAASDADVRIAGTPVKVTQRTEYPWKGDVAIALAPERPIELTLAVRIPGWARNEPVHTNLYRFADVSTERVTLSVNGRPVPVAMQDGFATIRPSLAQRRYRRSHAADAGTARAGERCRRRGPRQGRDRARTDRLLRRGRGQRIACRPSSAARGALQQHLRGGSSQGRRGDHEHRRRADDHGGPVLRVEQSRPRRNGRLVTLLNRRRRTPITGRSTTVSAPVRLSVRSVVSASRASRAHAHWTRTRV